MPLVLFYPSLSFSTLSIASTNRNFHDCPCLEDDSSLFTDWMDLQIFDDITYLDCYQDSPSSAATSAANYHTHLAYNTLFLGGTPLSFDNTSMLGDLFPIIIYSGTSLSILPQKSDFVGPHQNVDLWLGGMANRMIIEGKRKFDFYDTKWKNNNYKNCLLLCAWL